MTEVTGGTVKDENGNDGAIPGGGEIADVMLEIIGDRGWTAAWSNCNGLRICPRVRVWLDGYMDWDYEQVFLLRVWTDSDPDESGRHLTMTDQLAVYQRVEGKLSVEWRQDPRLFFDADAEWGYAGLHWWVDWIEGEREALNNLRPPMSESISAHNESVREGDRAQARRMGLVGALPYLAMTHSGRADD